MQNLATLFNRVRVAAPRQAGNLQIFGLSVLESEPFEYETLDEALNKHDLEVTELSEGGSVPTLKLLNKSDRRVFLMAGEQLIGAKQNRVLNTSLLVEGKSEVPIPVSCVEQGRWAYRGRNFGSKGTSSHTKLRHKMNKSVTMSYMACAMPRSDQGEVWSEVERKLSKMGSVSNSSALEQTYDDTAPRLDTMLHDMTAPPECVGAVFAINGQVIGLDLFDQPGTLVKLWPKLVRGYAIDALEDANASPPVLSVAEIESWLSRAQDLQPKSFPSPGLGQDVRLEGQQLVGAGLVVEDRPVHVQLFADLEG